MSEEDVNVVRQVYGAVARRDAEAVLALYDRDVEWDGSRVRWAEIGDQVMSVVTSRGRGRASGVEVEWKGLAGVWTVREGKVARVAWFSSREEALAAI